MTPVTITEPRAAASLVALSLALAACSGGGPVVVPSDHPTSSVSASPSPTASPTPRAPVRRRRAPARASIPREPCGSGGRTVAFRVEVDRGVRATAAEFGARVRSILCDARSWIASGEVRFRYDPGGALLVGLRTPGGAQDRCWRLVRKDVGYYFSCGAPGEIVINADRWFGGARRWPGSVARYREMVVNHETGHALGLHHRSCPADGAPAPVMMQQSKGLTSGSNTCEPNPWPTRAELDAL